MSCCRVRVRVRFSTAHVKQWCIVTCFLVPYFPYCKSNAFMFVIYIEPHTTGSCPECTDQTSAVVALGAVLVVVVVLFAVAIVIIALQYIRESQCCRKAFVKLLRD